MAPVRSLPLLLAAAVPWASVGEEGDAVDDQCDTMCGTDTMDDVAVWSFCVVGTGETIMDPFLFWNGTATEACVEKGGVVQSFRCSELNFADVPGSEKCRLYHYFKDKCCVPSEWNCQWSDVCQSSTVLEDKKLALCESQSATGIGNVTSIGPHDEMKESCETVGGTLHDMDGFGFPCSYFFDMFPSIPPEDRSCGSMRYWQDLCCEGGGVWDYGGDDEGSNKDCVSIPHKIIEIIRGRGMEPRLCGGHPGQ